MEWLLCVSCSHRQTILFNCLRNYKTLTRRLDSVSVVAFWSRSVESTVYLSVCSVIYLHLLQILYLWGQKENQFVVCRAHISFIILSGFPFGLAAIVFMIVLYMYYILCGDAAPSACIFPHRIPLIIDFMLRIVILSTMSSFIVAFVFIPILVAAR